MSCKDTLKEINQLVANNGNPVLTSHAIDFVGDDLGVKKEELLSRPELQPYAVAATLNTQTAAILNRTPGRYSELLALGRVADQAMKKIFLFFPPIPLADDQTASIILKNTRAKKVKLELNDQSVETKLLAKGFDGYFGIPTPQNYLFPLRPVLDLIVDEQDPFSNPSVFEKEPKTMAESLAEETITTQAKGSMNEGSIDLFSHLLTPDLFDETPTLASNFDLAKQIERYQKLVEQIKNAPEIDVSNDQCSEEVFNLLQKAAAEGKAENLETKIFKISGQAARNEYPSSASPDLKIVTQDYLFYNLKEPGNSLAEFNSLVELNPPLLLQTIEEVGQRTPVEDYSEVSFLSGHAISGLASANGVDADTIQKNLADKKNQKMTWITVKPQFGNMAFSLTDEVSQGIISQNPANHKAIAEKLAPGVAKMLANSIADPQGKEKLAIPTLTSAMAVFLVNSGLATRSTLLGKLNPNQTSPETLNRLSLYPQETKTGKYQLGNAHVAAFVDEMSSQVRQQLEKELVARQMPAERAARYAALHSRSGFQIGSLSQYFHFGDRVFQEGNLEERLHRTFGENAAEVIE